MQDSHKCLAKPVGSAEMDNAVAGVDPFGKWLRTCLMFTNKQLIYRGMGQNLGYLMSKMGFSSHTDVTEIILGNKCLNISIL